MNKDVIRAIGYLNLILAEERDKLWPGETMALLEARAALERLAKIGK